MAGSQKEINLDAMADGSRHEFDLEVIPLADGSSMPLPVLVLAGTGQHPRLVLIAGVHGDEPEGILTLMDLWNEIEPRDLTGRLIIVPVANPSAFAAGQRCSPIDGLDLNRSFPGRPGGSASQVLAHVLLTKVITGADFIFSLHSWFAQGDALPFVEVPSGSDAVSEISRRAAAHAGFARVRVLNWPDGLLVKCANGLGVAGMEAEIGGMGSTRTACREQYRRHVLLLMKHLGMTRCDDDGESQRAADATFYDGEHVLAPCGGVLRLQSELGDLVNAGSEIATITDLHGRPRETVRAPVSGTVVTRRTFGSVAPGDHVVTLFSLHDEEPTSDAEAMS